MSSVRGRAVGHGSMVKTSVLTHTIFTQHVLELFCFGVVNTDIAGTHQRASPDLSTGNGLVVIANQMLVPMKKEKIGTVAQPSLTKRSDSFNSSYLITFNFSVIFNKAIFTQSYSACDRILLSSKSPERSNSLMISSSVAPSSARSRINSLSWLWSYAPTRSIET